MDGNEAKTCPETICGNKRVSLHGKHVLKGAYLGIILLSPVLDCLKGSNEQFV